MEMMKLGARLATGTQVVLEKAETALGARGGLPEVEVDEETLSRYANQPGTTREGIQAGYTSLSRNINSAAQTILAVPMEVYERSGDDVSLSMTLALSASSLLPLVQEDW
jgi:autophagy-related protein 2